VTNSGSSRSADEGDRLADAIDPTFRSVAESVADNIILLDPDGVIKYANYTVPDLTVDQVLGTPVYRYVPDEYKGVMRRCHERVLQSGKPDRYETAYLSDEGEVSWWETRVSPVLRDGQVIGLVQIASNVTERRQAAADRDRLFNLSVDMLCVASTDGYFKRLNPAFEHTLGFTEQELLARPFLDFVHPDDRARTAAAVERISLGALVIDFENRYRCSDGSYRVLSWRAGTDASKKVIYAIARDVTERQKLEEQLRRAQKMEAVGQLAGGIAHDFNNLVLAIDLNVSLAMKAEDADKRVQYSNDALQAARRAAELTRQLLTLGQRTHATLVPLDLNAIVTELLTILRRLIEESIEIVFDPAQDLPSVLADAAQIEQVVLNLCLNARDAMPEGGRLTLSTAVEEAHGERWVALAVADTGVGMSADVREHAFEPFFTTKAPGRGTGLGLATVYGVVEQHGGTVRLHSEPGHGARFEVLLPASSDPAVSRTSAQPGAAPRGVETILVAEDEAGVRTAVTGLLEEAGYRVLLASDGEEAVRLFELHRGEVALALLDVVMPRLGGPAAARRMRELQADLPLVFTSGHGYAPEQASEGLSGAMRLDKPYVLDTLLRIVRQALDAPR